MQSALDRSYLDIEQGLIRKHSHLHHSKHSFADIYFSQTRPGSFIIKFEKAEQLTKRMLDRLSQVIRSPYERALSTNQDLTTTLNDDYESRLLQVNNSTQLQLYTSEIEDELVTRNYSERSIVKEIDQLVSPLRNGSDQNHINLKIVASNTVTYEFDRNKANYFHKIVSKRELGTPCIYHLNIRVINANTKKVTAMNAATRNQCTMHFRNDDIFREFTQAYNVNQNITIIASPVLEYSTYDTNAGDIYFISHG